MSRPAAYRSRPAWYSPAGGLPSDGWPGVGRLSMNPPRAGHRSPPPPAARARVRVAQPITDEYSVPLLSDTACFQRGAAMRPSWTARDAADLRAREPVGLGARPMYRASPPA